MHDGSSTENSGHQLRLSLGIHHSLHCETSSSSSLRSSSLFTYAALSGDNSKLLLSAKKARKATGAEFVVSLSGNDFSRSSSNYIGKLRSNLVIPCLIFCPPSLQTKETRR
ncbi:unnamed protein product [Microthlaspi erraticum]|uniref:Tubby C-terminal domain-containing protein n=1 Tax=Microthlaspi erraticum TaxID=1685480 RepID=A0A6D2IDQ6_9BRAS|nr:unnamed protein product [Microthlaspi erraticum]